MNMSKRSTVVIVDDNDMMRGILRGMLRGEEYEVIGEGRNGVVAVDIAERLKPEVICLDVMMPEKDGLQALCEIKAANPGIDVVMITSSSVRAVATVVEPNNFPTTGMSCSRVAADCLLSSRVA